MRARRRRRRDPRPHPDERALRVARTSAATRTGRSSYVAYVPGYSLFGWTGKWDDLPAAHFTSIAFDLLCVVGLALVGLALRRATARRDARVRLGGVSVHAVRVELEHERRDPARVPRAGASGSRRRRGRAAAFARARGLDEVRRRCSSCRSGRRIPARRDSRPLLRFAAGFLAATAAVVLGAPARAERAPRRARLLGPHVRLAARPRVAVLALGLGPVPRAGIPDLHVAPAGARGAPRRGRGRAGVRPAPQVAAPARGADRRARCSASSSC